MKTAIITDSNSGITQSMGNNLGIYVLPMPFLIDGQSFYEDINLTQDKFFEKLEKSFEVSTSQPSADDVTALWDKALSEYDEAVYIPMSSGLSGSCDTAEMLSQQPKYKDKIYVIDNHRISITQRESIMDALQLSKMGKTGSEIKQILIDTMSEASIYIMPATLWYLKRGGRITTAAAAIGTILKILPVLQIQGGKLEAFAKVKGIKAGKKTMMDAMAKDIEKRFGGKPSDINPKVKLAIAYTGDNKEALVFQNEVKKVFPHYDTYITPLSLSISCHIGNGALAIACSNKLENCPQTKYLFNDKPNEKKLTEADIKKIKKVQKLKQKADSINRKVEELENSR